MKCCYQLIQYEMQGPDIITCEQGSAISSTEKNHVGIWRRGISINKPKFRSLRRENQGEKHPQIPNRLEMRKEREQKKGMVFTSCRYYRPCKDLEFALNKGGFQQRNGIPRIIFQKDHFRYFVEQPWKRMYIFLETIQVVAVILLRPGDIDLTLKANKITG